MAAAFVAGAINEPTATTAALTFTVASGNGYVIAFEWDAAVNFTSIVSSLGNTLTQVGTEISAFGAKTRVYRCIPTSFGSDTVTVTVASSTLIIMTRDLVSGVTTATGSSTPTVDAASPWTGTNVTPTTSDNIIVSVCMNDTTNLSTFTAGNGFTKSQEEGDGSTKWPLVTAYKVTATTTADGGSFTSTQGTNAYVWNVAFMAAAGSPPTLSAATPSGTLGTSTSATLGATTDQASGTQYAVVSTTNNVSTATAAQIKAGQNSTGAAAAFANSAAVSTTSPSVGISGLSASTGYFYAEVQNNTNGDSNVVSGSFTTAAASTSRGNLLLLGVG